MSFSNEAKLIVQRVLDACVARELTLATAESCTGGLVAASLTDVPGASRVFIGGCVAYADAAKVAMLGVDPAILRQHGAVSDEVARAMAVGCCRRLGAAIGVSTTGIAGPGGGTSAKPVGTVHFAVAWDGVVTGYRLLLSGGRADVRAKTVTHVFEALVCHVAGERSREFLVGESLY